jgi:hypothetical protein
LTAAANVVPQVTVAAEPPSKVTVEPLNPIVSSEGVTYPQSSDTKADAADYDPGADHIDAASDVIHVRTIVVSLDRQGKAATANGVPCVDGKCRWSRASRTPCWRRTSCAVGRTTSRH